MRHSARPLHAPTRTPRRRLLATALALAGPVFALATLLGTAAQAAPTGALTGTVFGDANSNGRADSGEGLSGFTVQLSPSDGGRAVTARTGPGGRYAVTLSPGKYYVDGSGQGWYVIPKFVSLGTGAGQLDLRAVRPLGKVLAASLKFTADRYAAGDTARTVVTLTNTGSKPLRGITAACDRVGDPNELHAGTGWGLLAPNRSGVSVAAHSTFTMTVTNTVPSAARRFGRVVVACDFGYTGVDAGYRPQAIDRATVAGPRGAIDGTVSRQSDESPVAGVRVVLFSRDTCPVLRLETTTDAQGRFHYTDLSPELSFSVDVYPPAGLRVVGGNPSAVLVLGGETVRIGIGLQPGKDTKPEPSTACSAPTTSAAPSPQSSTSASSVPSSAMPATGPVLARTGATPSGLLWPAAIMIFVGLALLCRQRHAH